MADAESRWKRHRSNKQMDKKRAISGTFKAKNRPLNAISQSKYKTYKWAEEEEDTSKRVADPIVRTNFFIVPETSQYEHYWEGLEELLYGAKAGGAPHGEEDGAAAAERRPRRANVVASAAPTASPSKRTHANLDAAADTAEAAPKKKKLVKKVKAGAKAKKLVHTRFSDDE